MNTPETPELRKARQFDQLRRLGDAAMRVAEAASGATVDAYTPKPTPEPTQTTPADHALVFARAARLVRDVIALEIRLESGQTGRRISAFLPHDPRRALLRSVFHDATPPQPGRPQRLREIDDGIEDELRADPDKAKPIEELLTDIANRFQVMLTFSELPDEVLGMVKPAKRSNL